MTFCPSAWNVFWELYPYRDTNHIYTQFQLDNNNIKNVSYNGITIVFSYAECMRALQKKQDRETIEEMADFPLDARSTHIAFANVQGIIHSGIMYSD